LPKGWAVASVLEVFQINPKNNSIENADAGFVPMASITDGFSDCFSYEIRPWKAIKNGFTHFADNDVAVAKISPCLENRKSFVAKNLPNGIGAGTTELFVFRSSQIIPEYTLLFFKSDYFISSCVGTFNGVVGQQRASRNVIEELVFPIPPTSEQYRIVQKVRTLFDGIDVIDNGKGAVEESVARCRARILDLAIHGKLVPQNPTDEPAIELLRRVNPEFQPSDNLHYEGSIPSGWQIVRIGDVIDIVSGTSYQKTDIVSAGTGIRVLRGGNIQDGNILICEDDVFIDSSLANKCNTIGRGDTVIVASTGSCELIGKAAFATKDYPETQIGAFLRIIRPKSICISEYLGLIFQTEYYKHHIKQVAKGTNINNIKSSYITEFVIPLPPLEEQRRIQCQLKRLLSIIDQITDFINGSE
jgi:type I restriction enzyme S subunit